MNITISIVKEKSNMPKVYGRRLCSNCGMPLQGRIVYHRVRDNKKNLYFHSIPCLNEYNRKNYWKMSLPRYENDNQLFADGYDKVIII